MRDELFYHCNLSQGASRTSAFIPARGAILGANVEINEKGFDGLWRVDLVADRPVTSAALAAQQQKAREGYESIVGEKKPKG